MSDGGANYPTAVRGAWWRTNLSPHSVSRTRLGRLSREAAVSMPLPLSRAMNVARYLPLYLGDPGLRRQWAAEDAIERAFTRGIAPPPPLGRRTSGASERPIEIAWVLSRVDRSPRAKVLDVGSAFAPHTYRRLLHRWARGAELHLADLVSCNVEGAASHVADARELPFGDGTFDRAICISTLEHIGMDNREYGLEDDGQDAARGDGDDVAALREMGRVVRPSGRLLVTVPAGRAGDHGWFRQYSPERWQQTVARAGLRTHEVCYFGHTSRTGWCELESSNVERFTYGVDARAAAALICAALSPPDGA